MSFLCPDVTNPLKASYFAPQIVPRFEETGKDWYSFYITFNKIVATSCKFERIWFIAYCLFTGE